MPRELPQWIRDLMRQWAEEEHLWSREEGTTWGDKACVSRQRTTEVLKAYQEVSRPSVFIDNESLVQARDECLRQNKWLRDQTRNVWTAYWQVADERDHLIKILQKLEVPMVSMDSAVVRSIADDPEALRRVIDKWGSNTVVEGLLHRPDGEASTDPEPEG